MFVILDCDFPLAAAREPAGAAAELWELAPAQHDEGRGDLLPLHRPPQVAQETPVQDGTDWDPVFSCYTILHCLDII